ncbi:farnesol dehydrogenase-like [Schistocerca americana]|uniref:farnesol dehydrogenase-like n=1 Tax=Schistocerca americana TaxID=7009 RepID=UPI001F4FF539|nr:farnesol dehydrogenase-like [Schistocerca americana]
MDRWRGKVALVTGASAGIGRAVAKELVQQGLVVVGVARRLDLLEELSQEVCQLSLPGQLVPRQLDVTEDEAVEATFRWADDTLGGVDVLVNAAGVTSSCSLLGECEALANSSLSDWNAPASDAGCFVDLSVARVCGRLCWPRAGRLYFSRRGRRTERLTAAALWRPLASPSALRVAH